jgi:hypothetical protein
MTMGKFGDMLRREQQQEAAAEAAKITSGGRADGGGRFSAECDRSRKARRDVAVRRLQDELAKKPWLINSPSEIRARFGQDVPADEIDKILAVVYNDRHHHPSNVEKHFRNEAVVTNLIKTGLD